MVVWFAHVRVGHRQHLILNPSLQKQRGVLFGGWVLLLDSYQSLIEYYTNFFYNVRSFVRSFGFNFYIIISIITIFYIKIVEDYL
ncbi:hypothetical protein C0135_08125 [Moraxella catarrhalis]|nr:hypothetical protein [Moraxella catarrhalis]